MYGYKREAEKCAELAVEIAAMREKGDVQGQNYRADIKASGVMSDPVARHVETIITLERKLSCLSRRVRAVDQLREDLAKKSVITITSPRNLLRILEEYYIAQATVSEFLIQTHWVRSTYYVRRRELVILMGEYLRA